MPEDKQFIPPLETAMPQPGASEEGERTPESAVERARDTGAESKSSAPASQVKVIPPRVLEPEPLPVVSTKDPLFMEVEHVLEDGLMPYYQAMNPKNQQIFQKRGEELTKTLTEMVGSAHLQLRKVVELIRRWLMLIPGVNRFFLEQEAKIRADRIATIARFEEERRRTVK